MRRSLLTVSIVVCLLCVTGVQAQPTLAREAALLLRILSYDANLPTRVSQRVNVLVVYAQADNASKAEGRALVTAINELIGRVTVAGMPANAELHAFRDRGALVDSIAANGVAAVYVCKGLGRVTDDIVAAARKTRVLGLTADADAVREGLGVGMVKEGNRTKLLVNISASEAQGARFDTGFLRVAQVIR